ncbi:cytochrome c-type biogenesis protein [Atopomonas sediminilitoris]|uniref:cytochrome c-type biogenesis protein n=1 Tax=Atopomonas sediminilitoris TaxID=2919919 RepID=UPI001F4EC30A|nr:cytochrome c-type biogenesis protein [Atopomonas sediminilitoris]MCJ8167911.1 cytochrome c-type biogenesis protein CcmH [Atopomonas sediminilitoris]
MRRVLWLISALFAAWASMAVAAIDTYEFADEAQRQRFRVLTEELRCPKCQNQNIADSNAPIANDLRREIHRMLDEGQNDEQIVDYLVARYGDFVMYRPPLTGKTLLLWFGPALLLLLALLVLISVVRRRKASVQTTDNTALSAAERERLSHLLDKKSHD